ncbi:hypothetical protein CTheo_3889 [Ceratobasidium theobromae]|uniref:Uncharacterized protein n=1 Tax=Ceratobasidium theobromae TaxID=1582974 RepID=A0A5N5QLY6_9AGAM|nr:hypothetical protein CTheo_3889 [Ceratobasidium theobromae]
MLEAPQSLKRFSGPPILCAGLFKSPAAAQLESVIVKCRASHAAYFPKHRDATILMTETVESLPCLKELIFEDGVLPLYGIDYPQIGKILRAAPALVRAQLGCLELELDPDKLNWLFEHSPQLEVLYVRSGRNKPASGELWKTLGPVALKLKEACPRLRQMSVAYPGCEEASTITWMNGASTPSLGLKPFYPVL